MPWTYDPELRTLTVTTTTTVSMDDIERQLDQADFHLETPDERDRLFTLIGSCKEDTLSEKTEEDIRRAIDALDDEQDDGTYHKELLEGAA